MIVTLSMVIGGILIRFKFKVLVAIIYIRDETNDIALRLPKVNC